MLFSNAMLACALALAGAACSSPTGPRTYYMTPNEMMEIYGVYHMDNGETMRVSRERRRFWAETRATGKVEIRPVASYVFETVEEAEEGRLRLKFKPIAFATDVTVDWARAGRGP
jgi:hypothetical protein